MAHVMITHSVADFGTWEKAFIDALPMREEAGEKSAMIFRNSDDPSVITGLFEWDSTERAKEYVSSARLRTAMEGAGVTSPPQVTFLDGA